MRNLPEEIIEIILAHLPIQDLLLSCSLVSKQWSNIISRKNFVPWKKLYFSYCSQRNEESKIFIEKICKEYNISGSETCLKGLVNYVMNSDTKSCNSETIQFLKRKHGLYKHAEQAVLDQFQAVLVEVNPSLWGLTAMICIISPDAWEIYHLLDVLSHSVTDCTIMEATEKVYCICTFLLYFVRVFNIPARLHYNVFYALNLFENSWNVPKIKCQSLSQTAREIHSLTPEQSRIVNHRIEKEDLIKIVAFAGSGKTTTLLRLAEKNPALHFLFIVYNRAVADDAVRKFPSNVKCKTVHQLAYHYMIGNGPFKTKRQHLGNIYPTDLIEKSILGNHSIFKRFQREKLVIDTLNRFLGTADECISVDHTPDKIIKHSHDGEPPIETILSDGDRNSLVSDAQVVWSAVRNPHDIRLNMPHDAYLKLWQLKKPNLFKVEQVDCVLVDEGQDMNGAMLDIFLTHPGSRIIVGDPHQQIYSWRNAINALDKIPFTHAFYLTQSFRFGPEIGFMAHSCLSVLNNVQNKFLVGAKIRDSLADLNPISTYGCSGTSGRQICFLARTNLNLYKKVVQVLGCDVTSNSQKPKPRISFAGGLKNMNFELLIDIMNLRREAYDKIKCPFLRNRKRFPDFTAFTKYVDAVNDKEWSARIAIVNWSGDQTERYIEAIRECHVDVSDADVIFSTAHKAKGMEWESVALLDDFTPSLISKLGDISDEQQEERNLLYVAVTRAKRNLIVNPACFYTLLAVGERHERLVDTATYLDRHGPIVNCIRCTAVLPGQCAARSTSLCTIPLHIMTIKPGTSPAVQPGILCTLCAGLHCYTYIRYSCYENQFPPTEVKDDRGHMTFRFLAGPSNEEMTEIAQPYYDHQMNLMRGGFIQARNLAVPVVINLDDDDDEMMIQAMIMHENGHNGNVGDNDKREVLDWPNDDYLFPDDNNL